MLDVAGPSLRYGQHLALGDATLSVRDGEIVVPLGANGAGKSSLLTALGGTVVRPPGARIALDGLELAGLAPHQVVERGLVLVPEDRGLFADLDVREKFAAGSQRSPGARYRGDEPQQGLGVVCALGRAPAADRLYHERRRPAHGWHRPSLDVGSASVVAR